MLPDTLEPSLPEVALGLPGGLGQPCPPTVSSSLLGSILRLSPGSWPASRRREARKGRNPPSFSYTL